MKIIETNKAPKPIGPYSQAVIANGLMFISGQIPINALTSQIELGSISKQTDLVMSNLKNIVEEAGLTMACVVKTTVLLSNMNEFNEMNEIYGTYFTDNFPARACYEVTRLPKDVKVEIEAICVVE